ncbi:MAG: hypothetical protein WCG78_07580 [Candidatus Omnitrophota bacterium]
MGKHIKLIAMILSICFLWQQTAFALPVEHAKLRAMAYFERTLQLDEGTPTPLGPHKLRWWQFRLRTLFLLTTAVAMLLGGTLYTVPLPSIDNRAKLAEKYERLMLWSKFVNEKWSEHFKDKLQSYLYELIANKPEFASYGKSANIDVLSFSRGEKPATICIFGSLSATDVHSMISTEFVHGDFLAASAADGDWKFYDAERMRPRSDIQRVVLVERQSKRTGTNIEVVYSQDGKTHTMKEVPIYEHHLEWREYFCDNETGPAEGAQGMIMSFKGAEREQKVMAKLDMKKNIIGITAGTFGSAEYVKFWGLKEGEYSVSDPAAGELLDALRAEAELQKRCTVIPAGFQYYPQWMQDKYQPEPAPDYLDRVLGFLDRVRPPKGKEPPVRTGALGVFREYEIVSGAVSSDI